MHVRVLTMVALGCLIGPLAAQPGLSKADSTRFRSKLSDIIAYSEKVPPRNAVAKTTAITDAEVSAYLHYDGASEVPTGIAEPYLTAGGDGVVSGRAVVDLDVVRTQRERGWLDPLGYLTGRLPVTAAGRLLTKDGVGRFQLDSAQVSGVPVPKALVQEILSYYSRSAERPSGINMDDPFQLPARIKEIRIGRGSATIVQ